jgi:hypothetical protein
MVSRARDELTADLFEIPAAPALTVGSLNCSIEVANVLSEAIRTSGLSRYQIAARMSELTGEDITKTTLDAWTAESKAAWRFPFEYAAAFEVACNCNDLQELLARKRGARVLVGKDTLFAELGRIQQQRSELGEREKAIKRCLGDKKK